jgi:site-specific DNA-methyltransferase (adenine-specific)
MASMELKRKKAEPTSTVGRGKAITLKDLPINDRWSDEYVSLTFGNALNHYHEWETPTVIVSDGGYGVLGFEGDTSDHLGLPDWYEPHIAAWAEAATASTSLWFWNSEIGWAAVHPILEKYGWRYVNANVWDKGKGHIAGNVNTNAIRRFPVVTELCVQYTFEARLQGLRLNEWLLKEWKRTGLPVRLANAACGVADAAVRKYLDQGHLWYFPPPDKFMMLASYANEHGKQEGRPYFSIDGTNLPTEKEWADLRPKFRCPHGLTNVWRRNALRGNERVKTTAGKAIHLNQKPLDLMKVIIEATSDAGDVVWEPFGGLFTASLAARQLERKSFAAEIDPTYFQFGIQRFSQVTLPHSHLEFQDDAQVPF